MQAGRLCQAMHAKQTLRHAKMEQLCGRPGATGATCCMTFSMVHPGEGRRAHSARSLLQEGTQNCRRCSAPRALQPHFKALHASNTNRATHGSW